MKKFAKILCLMLALVFCVMSFAACGEESIVVGYTIYEPMNYKDADGNLIGFDTELAEKVFGNLGYKVIFKEIKWENKYTDLNSGTIDCIWNGFTCNTADKEDGVQRAEKVDFTYRYMENEQAVVVKTTSAIAAAADLNGKIGIAESGSAGETYAKGFEGAEIKVVTKQTDGLLAVNSGTAEFAVVDVQLAKSYCGKGDYADLKIVDGLNSDLEYYAIGFKKGSDLTEKVNAELEKLGEDGTLMTLAEKYGLGNSVVTDFTNQKVVAATAQ
jgi:polar amino acid transport system substrate-binding protein